MAIIDFGGTKEEVVMRNEFSMERARGVLKDETIAIIGYGVQGPGQALNLKDNGFRVIVGQSKKFMEDWNRAEKDGWKAGLDLFEIEEAVQRGTVVGFLIADAAHKAVWPLIKKNLGPGNALYFSHGFSIVYKDQTKVIPPDDIDVIMVAPKGSGTSLRRNFLSGEGINASFAVYQNATGRARERCVALGIGIGSGYLFPTTFEKEVYNDLVGERGVLMGALAGIMEAQYDVLRKHGHSPSEAFNETVEEFYLIECIKKEDISAQVLRLVRNRKCQLYSAIDCGYIVTADLSIDSLENGLFKVGEDYYSFELWDDAINLTVDPATSAKMISLRSFDLIWGTSLYANTMSNKA